MRHTGMVKSHAAKFRIEKNSNSPKKVPSGTQFEKKLATLVN